MTAQKLLVGSAVLLAAGSLSAAPTDLADLQDDSGDQLFTDVPSGKYFDTNASYVNLTDTSNELDDSNVTLLAESSASAGGNALGIYDNRNGSELQVFDFGEEPIVGTTLSFDVDSGLATNLGSGESAEVGTTFGFYIETSDGEKFYSDAEMNDSGDHAGLYSTVETSGEGLYGANIVAAFEDQDPANGDFNDLVVGFSDVAAVPEPGTLALFTVGMLGLGASRRRK